MLYAYSDASQSVAASGNIVPTDIALKVGCSETLTSSGVRINHPGIYKVIAREAVQANGVTGIAIAIDDSIVKGSQVTVTATETTSREVETFAIFKVSNVCCAENVAPVNLTFKNPGVAATVLKFAIAVERIQ